MPMTREQVLSLVEGMLKSPKVKANLGAVLGYGHVPEMEDWDNSGEVSVDRCDEFVDYLEEAAGVLREIQKNRERQKEIPLEGEERGKKRKTA